MSDHEVENVVRSFVWRLIGNTRLLQEIGLDIGGSDLGGGTEVNTDELSLFQKVGKRE